MTAAQAPDPEDAQVFAAAGALLDTGRSLAALSLALTVLAFAALLIRPWPGIGAAALSISAAAGLAALYAGARVAFDAALFQGLARGAAGPARGAAGLAGMDRALLQLGLLPPGKAGRPMAARFAGARRLMLRQALLLGLQAALLLVAAWIR